MGSARASRAVPCAPRGTPGVHWHSVHLGSPGVFREGAKYGTRGACAPHARRPAFSAPSQSPYLLKMVLIPTRETPRRDAESD